MDTININLNINKDNLNYLLDLLKPLKFINNIGVTVDIDVYQEPAKSEVLQNLKEALHEVKLYREGKKQLQSAKNFMNEL